MEAARILLMSASPRSREVLPKAIHDLRPNLSIEVAARISEAVEKASAKPFDAAVVCADTPDELAYLIRIKKRKPDLPVVMLTRVSEPGFESLSEAMGAEVIIKKSSGLEETTRALVTALEMRALVRAQKPLIARSGELAREIRELARQNRRLIEMAMGFSAAEESGFYTLLVEDDPSQALFLVRALARAKLSPFVRTVETVDAGMDYLAGVGPYADRERHPIPALIISDLNLPGKSGLDFLKWVRSRPETRNTGFIMLTSSERDQDIDEAYRLGANLYLIKQERPGEIVDVVRTVLAQYHARKAGFGPV